MSRLSYDDLFLELGGVSFLHLAYGGRWGPPVSARLQYACCRTSTCRTWYTKAAYETTVSAGEALSHQGKLLQGLNDIDADKIAYSACSTSTANNMKTDSP